MASFKRKKVEHQGSKFKRLQGDMAVKLAADTYEHLQALAQDATTGLFCKYVAGDANKGQIAGLYTGFTESVEEGIIGNVTTFAIVGQSDIVGIDFDTDFTALSQLKQSGIIVVEKIQGTEEA